MTNIFSVSGFALMESPGFAPRCRVQNFSRHADLRNLNPKPL